MNRCKCGSYAINADPEQILCDVCYAFKKGFAAGQAAEREECAKIAEDRQGTVSQFATHRECAAFNTACR